MRKSPAIFLLFLLIAVSSCSGSRGSDKKAAAPVTTKGLTIGELPDVDIDAVLEHTRTLSSDMFEGRAPGTKGETLTVNFLVSQYKRAGLAGGNNGSYLQKVPLVGIAADGSPLVLQKDERKKRLRWKEDVVAWTKHVAPSASIENSELVFVGYGTVAPEYRWDDYKGVDVTGKTLVMLINDPPVTDPSNPDELDPGIFGGKAMTYYGRWTYKFEIGAEKHAAGVLIVHENGPAGYPFAVIQDSNVGEKFDLVTPDKNMGRVPIEGWLSEAAGRDLLKFAGQDFESLKRQAATRDFKPVALDVRASMTLHNTLRMIDSTNVVAKLEGSDPKLKEEVVVYTAHWDHLGIGAPVNGDRVYNGAADNAVGSAAIIEIGRAFKKLAAPPKRSIVFLNATAEEHGLLGSAYYMRFPLYPLAKTVAAINLDGLNIHGRTRDLTLVGYGSSDLDDYVRDAAGEQGRVIRPDPEPEKGFYYRSDHFNFAKHGIPVLDPKEGVDFIGKPADYGQRVKAAYAEHDYHQPSDVVNKDWDLSGAREDLKVFFAVGYRVAQIDVIPALKPGSEFRRRASRR